MKKIAVQAPASTMLFGEHAVLRSKLAVVAAIDRFLRLELTPREDDLLSVGEHTTRLSDIHFPPSLRFVEGVFQRYRTEISHGFDVAISSEISQTVGLASSASVTVALVAALEAYLGRDHMRLLMQSSVDIVRSVQGGVGSGADIASIIHGGVIAYQSDSMDVQKLSDFLPITLIHCGYKVKTPAVIEIVNRREAKNPELFRLLFETVDAITKRAISAIIGGDLEQLGKYMDMAQGCMEAMQISTKDLSNIVWESRSCPGVYGAKISGSGLGDSVVALGAFSTIQTGHLVPGSVTARGVQIQTV